MEQYNNLNSLKCFHTVIEQGSFIQAANTLGISNSAVSSSIKKLEQNLNVRLIERSTRKMRITTEGIAFYEHSRSAINNLNYAFDKVRKISSGVKGQIKISAPTDMARTRLLTMLKTFCTINPNITINLRTSDAVDDIIKGNIDVAIRYGFPNDSSLIARPLSSKKRILCAAPSYLSQIKPIIYPEQLSSLSCICYQVKNRIDNIWSFIDNKKENTIVHVLPSFTTDDSSVAREWAKLGMGIVYKSAIDLHTDLQDGSLIPILQDYEGQASPLYAIYPSSQYKSARITKLLDYLLQFEW